MFQTTTITRGLNFAKIIGGLSKSLQIANQIIPLYQKARPAILNAKNMLGMLKEITKSSPSSVTPKFTIQNTENEEQKEKASTTPTFFL